MLLVAVATIAAPLQQRRLQRLVYNDWDS